MHHCNITLSCFTASLSGKLAAVPSKNPSPLCGSRGRLYILWNLSIAFVCIIVESFAAVLALFDLTQQEGRRTTRRSGEMPPTITAMGRTCARPVLFTLLPTLRLTPSTTTPESTLPS